MIFSVLFFCFIFEYVDNTLKYKASFKDDDVNKIISTVHSGILTWSSFCYIFKAISINTFNYFLLFSMGYALFDINNLYCINYRHKYILTIHHLLIITACSSVINSNNETYYYLLSINLFSEVTNIFLNNTLYLYENNLTKDPLFYYNTILLLTSYFIVRVLGGLWCIFYMLMYNTDFICTQLLITSMNIHWFSKLILKYNRMKKKIKDM